MKKILSLGIASAVLALTAISASAAVKVESDDAAPKAGETYTVYVTSDEVVTNYAISVEVEGLKIDGVTAAAGGAKSIKSDTVANFSGANLDGYEVGTKLAILTCTVTAAEGENVSITVTDKEGDSLNGTSGAIAVVAGTGDAQDPTDPGTSDPGTSTPGTSTPGTSDPNKDNPETGVALAVVPAVLAGAAVVVAKKRK